MIKKNLIYILPILAISSLMFMKTSLKFQVSNHENFTNSQTSSFHNTSLNQGTKATKNKHPLALINAYKNRLAKVNFSKKFANEVKNLGTTKGSDTKTFKPLKSKGKKQASDKNVKKNKKKKVAKETEKKAENHTNKKTTKKAFSKTKSKLPASILNAKSDSFKPFISFSSINQRKEINFNEEIKTSSNKEENEEEEEEDSTEIFNSKPLDSKVKNFQDFSVSYFNNLLVNEKFQEFDQALKTILKTQNNSNKLITAYTTLLKFLFIQEDKDFALYDNFLRTQFLKHSLATTIAKTFSNKTLPLEHIEYSAGLLNDLVLSWDPRQNDNDEFIEIYQLSVLNAIDSGIANNEALLTLQESISTTLFNISNPSIEVSIN